MTHENEGAQREVRTGPELYQLGLDWLAIARTQWSMLVEEGADEVAHETSAAGAAAIAAAAFAGVQAAALATLSSDEANEPALSEAWRTVVGDTVDTPGMPV